jgi:hypothetical protein
MRSRTAAVLALLPLAACDAMSLEARSFAPDARLLPGAVRVRVVDDRAGAVRLTSSGSRPTVAFVLSLDALAASEPAGTAGGGSRVALQVAVDSSASALLSIPDTTRIAGRAVRVTLLAAALAIPGTTESIDLLGGAAPVTIPHDIALSRHGRGSPAITIDLNSARWLDPVDAPLPGESSYVFHGTTAFLAALRITTH